MQNQLLRLSLLSVLAMLCGVNVSAQSYTDEAMDITWSMANGADSKSTATPADVFMYADWAMGSNIVIDAKATDTYYNNVSTRFTNLEKKDNVRSKIDENYIEFKFKPYAGLTVTPKTLSFDIVKVGTGDPKIWVECIQDGTTTSIAEEVVIRKNGEAEPSEHQSFDLTTISGIKATAGETALRIYIGKLATNKQVALANVKVGGTVDGKVTKYTTVYDIAQTLVDADKVFEGNSGTIAPTSTEEGSNAFDMKVDALKGKVGKNNTSWAQFTKGAVLTIPGVPQGAKVTFALYNDTELSINGVKYGNGQTYTATKDVNLKMTSESANGYIKSITVEGTAFVKVLDSDGYTNTWQFGKSNEAPEFALEKSAEYVYTVEERSITINTSAGKLNNASRTDEYAQCNDGTKFKVPVYAGAKLSWGGYNKGSEAGFIINDQLYNEYFIGTEETTMDITAKGIGFLSYIRIEPVTMCEISGTISGGTVDGASILFTGSNGQKYSAKIATGAFTLKLPADTYTMDLSEEVAYVVSAPENLVVSADANVGAITIKAAEPQTVTGQITNAPATAFTLTFTGASHNKQVECEANATSYTVLLDPDTYTISSSVGELSNLSKASFKILKEAGSHNIYYPEAAVPAATQQNITVDNTATVAANTYRTVTDALAAAKAGNIANPIITLTSGQTYREQVIIDVNNVTLKTSGAEKATITFYYGIGYTYYSIDSNGYYDKDRANTRNSILKRDPDRWGCTVRVKGSNFLADNIIFENSFNQYYTTEEVTDGVRPNGAQSITYDRTLTEGSSYQPADAKAVTERAAAIAVDNNHSQFYNCVFRGSQDTFYSSGKIYVKNCNIEGNTDYIFGGGYAVFDNCDLTIGGYSDKETSAYITAYKDGETLNASKKYVFRDCTVKKTDRQYVLANLGRDWGGAAASVYFFNLKNEIGDKLKYTWTNMGNGVSAGTADLHIYDFDPAINVNYNKTGYDSSAKAGNANVNGLLADDQALEIYSDVVTKLGFTPERIYEDAVVLDENSAYNLCRIAANNSIERKVSLTRTLNANEWNAIVLPFALTADQIAATFGAGTKVAELKTADNATLNFTPVTAMEANKPYLIKAAAAFTSADINGVTFSAVTSDETIGNWNVTGTYAAIKVPAGNFFIREGKVNKAADANTDMKAFDAYFANASAAEEVTFTVEGEATDIKTIETPEHLTGAIYNLQGVRVNKMTRGIYIINGKTVVVK